MNIIVSPSYAALAATAECEIEAVANDHAEDCPVCQADAPCMIAEALSRATAELTHLNGMLTTREGAKP